NLSSVTDASQMFFNCSQLENLDLHSLSSSELSNIEYMFCKTSSSVTSTLEIDLSNINTTTISANRIYKFFGEYGTLAPSAKVKWSNQNETVAMPLIGADPFYNSKFLQSGSNFYIYVPDSLYDTYKTMVNWKDVYNAGNLKKLSEWNNALL
ncbi:MAG: BspA family leucine-rich repeat surface protein, partial [Bacilli bacterium]|nr:BspA family leucine-rich repeat surface protein [Bacilli bacterium]